jgi:hypothetical protein
MLRAGGNTVNQACRSRTGEGMMARCEVCGNEYYLSFEVIAAGNRHVFDSFECAIHKLAPVCAHCGVKVIGHGVEGKNEIFCCANCARQAGVQGVADQAEERARQG